MKKLMIVAAMLAMMMVAAAPAFAQQTSGDASFSAVLANEKGNQCAQLINQQNTGNVQNNATVDQDQFQIGLNIGLILDLLDLLGGGDNLLEQINSQVQNATIDQTGVAQVAAAEQNCTQELK